MQEDDSCEVMHLCYEIVDVVVLPVVPKETLQPLNTYCGGGIEDWHRGVNANWVDIDIDEEVQDMTVDNKNLDAVVEFLCIAYSTGWDGWVTSKQHFTNNIMLTCSVIPLKLCSSSGQ